ncbi:MAG TPA: TetR/AcrR family transcriptional regulator C-terminal domain-containing protein [Thermomicrobiales bacterium]|nr:TetR/AcrR family transcriptional regulator C-terminal domain-containing protein [Thermomicrobiales bacterium]
MPRIARISAEGIVLAAIAVADRGGLESLTMARVGRELGVEAMALYRYFPGKDSLLDAVAEHLIGEITLKPDDTNWEQAARAALQSIRDLARRHPALFAMALERAPRALAEAHLVDQFLALMRREGLGGPDALRLFRLLSDYAIGFALSELRGFVLEGEALGVTADADTFPEVARLVSALGPPDHDADFAFGLDLLFAGAHAMLAGRETGTT